MVSITILSFTKEEEEDEEEKEVSDNIPEHEEVPSDCAESVLTKTSDPNQVKFDFAKNSEGNRKQNVCKMHGPVHCIIIASNQFLRFTNLSITL